MRTSPRARSTRSARSGQADAEERRLARLRRFWARIREIGLSEEEARDIVEDETGQRRVSTLNPVEMARVLDRLDGRLSRRPGDASHGQIRKIVKLGYICFSGDTTAEARAESGRRLRGWIKHMTRGLVSRPDNLSRRQAMMVIESLVGMGQRTGKITADDADGADQGPEEGTGHVDGETV